MTDRVLNPQQFFFHGTNASAADGILESGADVTGQHSGSGKVGFHLSKKFNHASDVARDWSHFEGMEPAVLSGQVEQPKNPKIFSSTQEVNDYVKAHTDDPSKTVEHVAQEQGHDYIEYPYEDGFHSPYAGDKGDQRTASVVLKPGMFKPVNYRGADDQDQWENWTNLR